MKPFQLRDTLTRMKNKARLTSFSKPEISRALNPLLGRVGSLEVRLVTTKAELKAAQKLRYQVFYEEMSAKGSSLNKMRKLDRDRFDQICDHLIVVDTQVHTRNEKIVGTYRLLRQDVADRNNGFYTQGEYNIDTLIDRHPGKRFLELGRSCVLEKYRTKRTVELLWHGIWTYTRHYKVEVMFGCASLAGTDPSTIKDQLSVLSTANPAPKDWSVRAHEKLYVPMASSTTPSTRQALSTLPPLIKGYLRLGAYIGDGAVIDHDFGTTDVLIILPIENINPRYVTYYGEDASRHAA